MNEQREKPGISPEQLNETFGLPIDTPTLASGGQIENFRQGWAVNIISQGALIAHNFSRTDFEHAAAKCGVHSKVRWIYGPGNAPRCQNCLRNMGNVR